LVLLLKWLFFFYFVLEIHVVVSDGWAELFVYGGKMGNNHNLLLTIVRTGLWLPIVHDCAIALSLGYISLLRDFLGEPLHQQLIELQIKWAWSPVLCQRPLVYIYIS
jgi:hypothetical protein